MAETHDKPSPGSKSETVSAALDTVGGWAAKALASVTSQKQSFVDMVAMTDMYEREAGDIALKRSRREDVKQFAQQMIEDHSKTTEELKSMVGAMNDPMTLPSKPNALFQILLDDLNGAADGNFDTRYVSQQKDVHGIAITLVEHYRDHGDNTALRELCKLALPVLQHHKEMADRMAETV